MNKNSRDLIKIPKVIEKPRGKRIIVLSPHFDDETLGCGGTLIKHVKNKDQISIVYLTDSSLGISGKSREETKEIRQEEAKKAWKILGIKKIFLLNEINGFEKIKKESVTKFIEILIREKPDLIYVPNFLDNHIDHRKANIILREAIKNYKKNFNVCAYEVWTPIPFPNTIIDIGKEMQQKERAMECYKSQVKEVDYFSTTKGLNKYRSVYNLKGRTYAEAFLILPIKEYIKKIK